jgi:hypothetical protein
MKLFTIEELAFMTCHEYRHQFIECNTHLETRVEYQDIDVHKVVSPSTVQNSQLNPALTILQFSKTSHLLLFDYFQRI